METTRYNFFFFYRSRSIQTLNTRRATVGTGRRRCSAHVQSHRLSRQTSGKCCWTLNKILPTWRRRSPIAAGWVNGSRTTKTAVKRKLSAVAVAEVERTRKGCSDTVRLVRTKIPVVEMIDQHIYHERCHHQQLPVNTYYPKNQICINHRFQNCPNEL